MGLELNRIHKYSKIPGTNNVVMQRVDPALSVKEGEYPPIWVQFGQLWWEGGDKIREDDDWEWGLKYLNMVNEDRRYTVGLPTGEITKEGLLLMNAITPAMKPEPESESELEETVEEIPNPKKRTRKKKAKT